MRVARIIRRSVRQQRNGINVSAEVNAVVAANSGEGGVTHTSVTSHTPIVQRPNKDTTDGKTAGGSR